GDHRLSRGILSAPPKRDKLTASAILTWSSPGSIRSGPRTTPKVLKRLSPEHVLGRCVTCFVMAGLRPGHPRLGPASKTWMPGTKPGHDVERVYRARRGQPGSGDHRLSRGISADAPFARACARASRHMFRHGRASSPSRMFPA